PRTRLDGAVQMSVADELRDAGAFQLDDRGTVAASRYGYELAAFGGERAVQNNQRDGCAEYAHAQRGGLAVIRGKPRGDHLVQIGGQYVDLAGHAQHAGYGVRSQAAHDGQDEGGQDGRPENRQGDPQQGAPGARPEDPRRFFQRNVEGCHGRGDDQVGDGHVQQAFD